MSQEKGYIPRRARQRRFIPGQKTDTARRGNMDISFLLLVLLLTAIGLVMLFSASFPSAYYETDGQNPAYYFKRQAVFAVIGFFAMFFLANVDYQRLRGAAKPLLGLSIFLLVLVVIPGVGITVNHATRWLGIPGVFTFQPSEVAKLAVILYFGDSISKKKQQMLTFRQGIRPYLIILAILSVLMMLEPHLSGTILIVGTGLTMMIVGGIPGKWAALGIGGAAAAAVAYVKLVEAEIISYGANRIQMWHNPWLDTRDDGYQMVQSLIAIGSGGLLGLGLGKSRQKFLYLPEESNDFIFSVICEELGLIGACVIMLIFSLLIIRGFWIALRARDRFGSLIVVGIMTHLGLQTFLNIAVVTGLVPATGISLPFFSYGGTALLLQLAEMGIVLSVSRQIPAPREG